MDGADIEQGLRMEEALNKMGLSMYTDEWAAKVLAFTYCLNGTDEVVVTNPALNFAIQCCFKKLYPAGRINNTLAGIMLDYIKELQEKGLATPWINDVFKRYGLTGVKQMWSDAGYNEGIPKKKRYEEEE
jgi:hypothetical protein